MNESALTVKDNNAVPLLKALDLRLIGALRAGAVLLVDADWIRSGAMTKLLRRQDLENLERQTGQQIFLPREVAAKLVALGTREVAGLTYGWATPDNPDPTGTYLANVRQALRSPLASHVKGIFWDYCSLHQKDENGERTPSERAAFAHALTVMGDVYASPLGTTVLRHASVPERPAALDGDLLLLGPAESAGPAVQAALNLYGEVKACRYDAQRRWHAKFATHDAAVAAVDGLAADLSILPGFLACFCYFNDRPYFARGWPNLESGVSGEAVARSNFYPGLQTLLDSRLPPKVIEIDGDTCQAASSQGSDDDGAGPRIERVRAAIAGAFFTGKGDKEVVISLYNDYVTTITSAMNRSELEEAVYEGEYSADGQPEGRGTSRAKSGDVYTGEFKASKFHGRGCMRFASGDSYEGEWMSMKRHGQGAYRYANGDLMEGEWRDDEPHGQGVHRYVDGRHYEGEFRLGAKHGRGTEWAANGDVFQGEFKAGKRHGHGIYWYAADGKVFASRFKGEAPIGKGAAWTADRQQAARLQNGQPVEDVSPAKADEIAQTLGLSVPVEIPVPSEQGSGASNPTSA